MKKYYINLKKFNNTVYYGFFKSTGGVSSGNFNSLNCNIHNKDKKGNVLKNLSIALKNLSVEDKKLKLINQIHSNKVFDINDKNYNKILSGDGLITQNKNIALGVLTADCAPIFIFDKKKRVVCCLHSGWRGTLNNIIEKGIKRVKSKKIKNSEIVVIIGPCLASTNFEVGKDFKYKFIKKNKYYLRFFKYKNKNKDLFNLRGIINYQIKKEGIKNIYNIRKDTYKNSQIFFSHRRASHEKRPSTGRMINIISLKD